MPQIRIQSWPTRLDIHTKDAQLHIQQEKADMSIEQPKADLQIRQKQGKLTIDQSQAWRDMNLLSVYESIEEFARLGRDGWLAGIARVSRQGDELMKIEHAGNPIAAQAEENGFDPPKEFNIGWIPSVFAVKTHYEPGGADIHAEPQKPKISVRPRKPNIQYEPWHVNINVAQYPKLEIDVEDLKWRNFSFEITI
ncbi:DUF6470 family protein [Melghiribacillus thermohalophilus]|nr:DUF6470 family protein [Melghiribacillus thermohalophilus]